MSSLAEVSAAPVLEVLNRVLSVPGAGRPVVFDADGTLWRGDVGEELLRAFAAEDRFPAHRGRRDLWPEYERLHALEPAQAYAFNARVLEGWKEAELEAACAALVNARFQGRLFRFAKPWLRALEAQGYQPWICSASPVWVVRAGGALVGIPPERCLGVGCRVDGGVITAEVLAPVTAGDGKVQRLNALGLAPALAVGNGDLDLPMLAMAAEAIVVAPWNDPGNHLVQEASRRHWPVQRG